MTTYADAIDADSRTPVTLAVVTLDFCANVFGVAPCTATGEPCRNTYPTCKDKANFVRTTKDYKFCSADAPLPFAGPRPYIARVRYLPTEIKDSITVNARVTIDMLDEPDGDVGIDPYLDQRASVPQTSFWKKLLARNGNYAGRPVRILEGVLGMAEGDFEERWAGVIDGVKLGRGQVSIEVVDKLKALSKVQTPAKLGLKLVVDLQIGAEIVGLDGTEGLTPSGYVKLGKEIVQYAAIDETRNQLTGCTRGAFGTVEENHGAGDKVSPVTYYAPTNPFDILKGMLLNDPDPLVSYPDPPGAGLSAADVDSVAFDFWRDWGAVEVPYSAIIVEAEKMDKLFWEIVELLDLQVWYSEGQKITCRRRALTATEAPPAWSDEAQVVHASGGVDLNPGSRLSRVVLRWDKDVLGKKDEPEDFYAVDVSVVASAETEAEYGEPAEKEIFCRWLRKSQAAGGAYIDEETLTAYVRGLTARRVLSRRDPMALIDLEVELKDGAVRTGDHVRLTTDELLLPDGRPLDAALFQVVKRNPKGGTLAYRVLRRPDARTALFAPQGHPDYADALDAERVYGFFSDAAGNLPGGDPGYVFW